ncbi:MAG TPA: prephenate dehydrogenase/arogenate dehydrogenase family protein [Fimbriimonas sp.]|nr:prephenate dehydrogenase/arogenate dehydrogenase family protein [Fimbriimonas sp.]
MNPKRVSIIGTGLIGASIGLALKSLGVEVLGCDRSVENLEIAKRRQAIDSMVELSAAAEADFVFVCVPPSALLATCSELLPLVTEDAVVTDCGSVKSEMASLAREFPNFVPGHPMAGHEKGGPKFATPWLFKNAKWLLTPVAETSAAAIDRAKQMVRLLEADPVMIGADEHDKFVAICSHLPHVLAGSLVRLATEHQLPEMFGGSWKDLTRVAGVDPGLWSDILISNSAELPAVLQAMEAEIAAVRLLVESGDRAAVAEWFKEVQIAKGD